MRWRRRRTVSRRRTCPDIFGLSDRRRHRRGIRVVSHDLADGRAGAVPAWGDGAFVILWRGRSAQPLLPLEVAVVVVGAGGAHAVRRMRTMDDADLKEGDDIICELALGWRWQKWSRTLSAIKILSSTFAAFLRKFLLAQLKIVRSNSSKQFSLHQCMILFASLARSILIKGRRRRFCANCIFWTMIKGNKNVQSRGSAIFSFFVTYFISR